MLWPVKPNGIMLILLTLCNNIAKDNSYYSILLYAAAYCFVTT